MNYKKTLENIHNKFPEFTVDQLLGIMDCIVEEPVLNIDLNKPHKRDIDFPYKDPFGPPWTSAPVIEPNKIYYTTSTSTKPEEPILAY